MEIYVIFIGLPKCRGYKFAKFKVNELLVYISGNDFSRRISV